MNRVTETISALIARRVPGPFREAGGLPGEQSRWRIDAAARNYVWNRRVRGMGAQAALEAAAPVALLPHTVRRPQWYGNRGGAGAPFDHGRDRFRWIENTEAAGLRFVAWADEVKGAGVDHTGWYCTEENWTGETLRGGVWQLPGKGGASRLLYGYAEFEGRGEMNPGSAALCVSDVVSVPTVDDWRGDLIGADETADAARWADGVAESVAEDRRDYDSAYQAGRKAAERDNAALEARRELLPLLGELRALRRSAAAGTVPASCKALRSAVDSLLETISSKREKRDSAWADVWSASREAWADGFMDESEGGFVRAVRLGYASRDDWGGAPEANPMGALA